MQNVSLLARKMSELWLFKILTSKVEAEAEVEIEAEAEVKTVARYS